MIRLSGIGKSFPGVVAPVLHDVTLEIGRGEIFGVIGASGAGKSTLVRLINLLERPTRGRIEVDGADVTEAQGPALRALRQKIGMVFQHFNLLTSRTVAGNVAYPLEIAGGQSKAGIARRVAELLQLVGLTDHADKYPRQLSGGQKQRVGIARALANKPNVLLCDEATSALDPQTTASVLDLLRDINRDLRVTIVLITHEMDVIRRACDQVVVLDKGRVVETGPVAEVFLHPTHPVTLGLVRQAEHDDTDASQVAHSGEGRLVRLTQTGPGARDALLARTFRKRGVDHALLAGRVGQIRDLPYAQFVARLTGGDIDAALTDLQANGVRVDHLDEAESPVPERLLHVV